MPHPSVSRETYYFSLILTRLFHFSTHRDPAVFNITKTPQKRCLWVPRSSNGEVNISVPNKTAGANAANMRFYVTPAALTRIIHPNTHAHKVFCPSCFATFRRFSLPIFRGMNTKLFPLTPFCILRNCH